MGLLPTGAQNVPVNNKNEKCRSKVKALVLMTAILFVVGMTQHRQTDRHCGFKIKVLKNG